MSYTDNERICLDSVEPLIEEAERNNAMLYHSSLAIGQHWFTPQELRKRHADHRFILSATNWRVRSRNDYVLRLEDERGDYLQKVREITKRIDEIALGIPD